MVLRFIHIVLLFQLSISGIFAAASAFEIPAKFADAQMSIQAEPPEKFSAQEIMSGDFVKRKKKERQTCRRGGAEPMVEAAGTDAGLVTFVEASDLVLTLEDMEQKGLREGRVERQPWSGDYWPYAKGLLGARFKDSEFKELTNWLSRFQFVQSRSAGRLLEMSGERAIYKLSPSEKYDLLTGDDNGGFTSSMWAQGKAYFNKTGKVQEWMGICHGWAPAAMMEPRPAQTAEFLSLRNRWRVPLNPSEVKGILSYDWATNGFAQTFMGERCDKKNPERDEHGRIIDPECFDLNPATWHKVIVNRVGAQRTSFVMDATYDYEVWNQPVLGYKYEYFDPRTGTVVPDLESATVEREKYTADPFARYRARATKNIVGIVMTVGYVVEVPASNESADYERNDVIRWVQYKYDLEIDARGNIAGGEWYQPAHPDFVWTPLRGTRPVSPLDLKLKVSQWEASEGMPAEWSEAAKVSSRYGYIVDKIARAILKEAAR
jgi:hypothetical protein